MEAQARVVATAGEPGLPPGLNIDVDKSLSTSYLIEIDEAAKDQRISRRQGKTLKKTLRRLQSECMDAYINGEDMEVWMRRIQAKPDKEGLRNQCLWQG